MYNFYPSINVLASAIEYTIRPFILPQFLEIYRSKLTWFYLDTVPNSSHQIPDPFSICFVYLNPSTRKILDMKIVW